MEPDPTEREAELAAVARSNFSSSFSSFCHSQEKEGECCRTGYEDGTFSKGMSKRIKEKILSVIHPHRKVCIRRMDTFFHISMEA